ncbi:MAG: tRNA pseudouridine(38-40) synthase TruA [Alphaproteobacteria bacterium]|jgi:tRNA pseudouridine38-40 synthase|nr:tRNA pseudouridine(38-40) synthase TruA [Alphaproteobacteria bacterium]
MTQRWKLIIEYDGRSFCGWQRQEHDPHSVQQVIEDAITAFTGEQARLHVAGRTDAGVHALAQVAHFDLEKEVDVAAVEGAINFHVRPHPVSILRAMPVSEDFHARFSAQARSYRYMLSNRRAPLALMAGRAWHFTRPLALGPMQQAAAMLIGHHDFSTFRAKHCQANSPMRTLDKLDVTQEGDVFLFDVKAKSFLYHQVRNMVGTLVMVGTGQWSLDDFAVAFAAKDRAKGGPTAPSDGLYFVNVDY